MGNRQGTRWRGKLPIPTHTHPLVRQLFEALNSERTTLTELARHSGIQRKTISDWRYRRRPTVDLLDAAFNALDRRLVVKRIRTPKADLSHRLAY